MMKSKVNRTLWLLVAAGLTVSACQTTSATGERRNPNVITAMELESVEVSSVYDAVQRLRPNWLQSQRRSPGSLHTGSRVVAFLNRTRLGDTFEVLRDVSLDEVVSIEYLGNAEAVARLPGLGSGHVGAAIVVHTHDAR